MSAIKRGRGRPRVYTDAEIELAFRLPRAAAAQALGKSIRAIDKLRERVRARQDREAFA